ncbi:MAG: dicarboxylate/amino acid:cation symporter [Firmicutes bacterium]|nr:dicarboxylate/amino acid:cation symporter [Bacillota bacterium]
MEQYQGKIHPEPLTRLVRHLQSLIQGKLWVKILVAMVAGITTGVLLSPQRGLIGLETAELIGSWLALPGNIFLGAIQMIVVPLIFASIIRGLAAGEDMEYLRRTGVRVVLYFLITTVLAIIIGLLVSTAINPGRFIDAGISAQLAPVGLNGEVGESPALGSLPEIVIGLIPQNPLGSMVNGEMLQIVLFAVIVGLALVSMAPRQAKPLLSLLGSLQEVCMTIVRWAMLLAPLAVFGLLAQVTIKVGLDALLGMAAYVGTVLLGLLLMLAVYLIIIALYCRQNPFSFLRAVREVQLLAFSTSSSAAVMPLSMQTAEEKLKVRPSISQFVIPLGASINMDGTALYQGAATVFLAQVYGVELGLPALLLIVVTAVGASIGTPATPGVGIVVLTMVLQSVGIPPSGIAMIIGVDRILDMSRTALNVTGDLTASLVLDRMVGGKKTAEEQMDEERRLDYNGDNVACEDDLIRLPG